jgi:translation initiation factor 3 subunit G
VNWKAQAKEEEKAGGEKGGIKDQLKDKKVKCRICSGEHFTARCPFKDTMAPVDEPTAGGAGGDLDLDEQPAAGGLGAGSSSYVPPHMRKGAAGAGAAAGDKMGGKYEKDDLATLRVTNVSLPFFSAVCLVHLLCFTARRNVRTTDTNPAGKQVSELAEEQELRDLFERFGRVTRVFLARDRETQRAKGFAFISFADRSDAARACEKLDGCKCSQCPLSKIASVTSPLTFGFSRSWLSSSYSSRGVREEDYLNACASYKTLGSFVRRVIKVMNGFFFFV